MEALANIVSLDLIEIGVQSVYQTVFFAFAEVDVGSQLTGYSPVSETWILHVTVRKENI